MIRKFLVNLVGTIKTTVRPRALRVPVLVTVVRGWLAVEVMAGIFRPALPVRFLPAPCPTSGDAFPGSCAFIRFSFPRR